MRQAHQFQSTTQMKKLFFFRSSGSGSGNNNPVPTLSTDKKVYWEHTSDCGTSPCLRRSLSFSSAALHDGALGSGQSGSTSSSSNASRKQSDQRSSRCRTITPERKIKARGYRAGSVQNSHGAGKTASSRTIHDCSESSSYCSSNASNKVLDRYIDGEQQQGRSMLKSNSSRRDYIGNVNGGSKRVPQVQYTAPASPTHSVMSHSSKEANGTRFHFSSRDGVENGFGHESPRRLAKHVIERLSQSHGFPQTSSNELEPDVPIAIEDVYDESFNRCHRLNPGSVSEKSLLDELNETTCGYQQPTVSSFQREIGFLGADRVVRKSFNTEKDSDVELLRKSKEAEERVMVLSEELKQANFLGGREFRVSALTQTIRNLMEERVSMAIEVSAVLQSQVSERALAREELGLVKAELDSRMRKLEEEKNELQSTLEKELDRRSNDWSFKLEKFQAEEHRLRERVRELAEQNVSLQREVSSFSEMELETKSMVTYSELQLKDLTTRVEEARDENQNLQQNLSELQEKYRAVEGDRDYIRRNYEEKERGCKELHKSIARFLRTCSEQEKTIEGLREGLTEEVRKNYLQNYDKQLVKFQMEQMRLTGVEQTLRKEVESYRLKVDSLQHENINLLHCLKGSGKEGGFSSLKLEQELQNRILCLQNVGLSLLNENNQLCSKLLNYIREKAGQIPETKQGIEVLKNGLEGEFVLEADMQIQRFKQSIGNLRRSLQTISDVLHEKSNLVSLESSSHCLEDKSAQPNNPSLEVITRSELKAETLLTSLLREKLYSKELDVEQLQADLAAAVRGNDVLKSELQNAVDVVSCVTHKVKDVELQMVKKDENIIRLQNDLQECTKELTILKGILPKVSEERDLMWEEVKQYCEKNMLLNSEVNFLKKKIETLDEDILLKEGQITILKDTLVKPFDLLASPDHTGEFPLE